MLTALLVPQEAAAEQKLAVIDVREPYEHESGHLNGSRHIELTRLTGEAASIDRDRPVAFYCRVGSRSGSD